MKQDQLLDIVQSGIKGDIGAYGKTNPEWYKTFKEAEELFIE